LDVQLIVIQRYAGSDGCEVFVAHPTFSAESIARTPVSSERKVARPELLAVAERYNSFADPEFKAVGIATYYRQIRPRAWPASARTHYEFYQTSSYLGAELHIESDKARPFQNSCRNWQARHYLAVRSNFNGIQTGRAGGAV
jgi:hypothetical protein